MKDGQIKFAVIKIPTIRDSAEWKEGVDIYFEDEQGNRVEGIDDPGFTGHHPIEVSPEHLSGEKVYVDQAMWHISNPTCITWNNQRR